MYVLLQFILDSGFDWLAEQDPMALLLASSALAAGIAMIGRIGTGIGQGYAAGKGAEGAAVNPKSLRQTTFVMLLSQAVTETSGIFCLVIALLLLYANPLLGSAGTVIVLVASTLAVGLSMISAFGPGVGQGYAGGQAVEAVSYRPRFSGPILRIFLVGQAISQSKVVYALIIALILLYANPLI